MSLIANLVTSMLASGCTAEQVAAAVRVVEDHENEKAKAVRAKWAEKKRKQRMSPNVSGTLGDNGGHRGTLGDPSFSPSNGFSPSVLYNINTPSSLTSPLSPEKNIKKSRSASSAEFDQFWNCYPKKVGRGAAEKAWLKAIAVTTAEEITRVVQAYPWGDDKQFIPHPATWLNQRRWQDQIDDGKPKPKTKEEQEAFLQDHYRKMEELWASNNQK